MARWFSRHPAFSALCFGVIAFAIYFLVLSPMGAPLHTLMITTFAVMCSWGALYLQSLASVSNAAVHALEEECDPDPLLELSREQLAVRARGREARRPYALTCRLNIATALTSLGRDREALEELDALGRLLPPKPGRLHVLYALNRSAVCFGLDRAQEMSGLLDRAESLMETLTLPPPLAGSCRFILRTNRAAYRYLTEGSLPEVEEVYRALLAEAATQRMKVGFHLTLGKLALARNGEAEARAHLAYAAEHGNKLYYRAEAEQLLAGLTPVP